MSAAFRAWQTEQQGPDKVHSIVNALEERLRGAEADRRDHKSDPDVVQRELLGYWRGINDALFAVKAELAKEPSAVALKKVCDERDRLRSYLRQVAHDTREMIEADEMFSRE